MKSGDQLSNNAVQRANKEAEIQGAVFNISFVEENRRTNG
jgi:hypothetical protein